MDRGHGAAAAVHGLDDRSRKGRLMGKLFGGRDRKTSNELHGEGADDDAINDFLHGPSAGASAGPASPRSSTATRPSFDGFQVAHASPPQLAKLDTRAASRYPNALPLANASAAAQSPSAAHAAAGSFYAGARKPPRPGVRGLSVRFADTYPEIIGEGGDESEIPPVEIGRRWRSIRQRAQPPPPPPPPPAASSSGSLPLRPPPMQPPPPKQLPMQPPMQPPTQPLPPLPRPRDDGDSFVPTPIRRTQTGYTSVSDAPSPSPVYDHRRGISPERHAPPVPPVPPVPPTPDRMPTGHLAPAALLDAGGRDEKRRSFIEIHQAEMREAEGRAFAIAARRGISPPSSPEVDEKLHKMSPVKPSPTKSRLTTITTPPPPPPPRHPRHLAFPAPLPDQKKPETSPILPPPPPPPATASSPDAAARAAVRPRKAAQEYSPPSAVSSPSSAVHRAIGAFRRNTSSRDDDAVSDCASEHASEPVSEPVSELVSEPVSEPASATSPRTPRFALHDVVQAASDDALDTFVNRSRHLFALFRLQAETLRPLSASSPADLVRAALWWFLLGRMTLENGFRQRSIALSNAAAAGKPLDADTYDMGIQQAYADLAKAYWLAGDVLPSTHGALSDQQVADVRTALLYNLRKLAVSMKRNNLLPPEDAFLPQTIDKTIWLAYPAISSDIQVLLWGHWGQWASSLAAAAAATPPPMAVLEALPLSDSAHEFVFSRMRADVYLMEQGRDTSSLPMQRFHFPCLLSVTRPQDSALLEVVVASQNETVQLRVRGQKTGTAGPIWEDVRWRSDVHSLELRLPRGFLLAVQLSQQDYSLLWSMYDFGAKIHEQLFPRKSEMPVFRATLKAFQYFESGPPTGSFPKDAVPQCNVAVFEKTLVESAATGRRHHHRGFRLAVVSGTRTRTLYGISQSYAPGTPLQFSFLRGDQGDPALLLRFENSRSKGSMVLTFASSAERIRLHALLAGTAVHHDERVVADVPLSSLDIRLASGGKGGRGGGAALASLKKMAFQRLRVVNVDDEPDETHAPTVLAEHLRMIFELGDCALVDRINVAPGELKLRLDVRDSTCLTLFRQAQQDLSMAVSDVQVPRETCRALAADLDAARGGPTCRTLRFASLADLHAVQQAVTGYRVLYDGVAATFAIARRRMVVPIHKKWEAGATRLQVVSHPDTKVVQLLAFFHDFHYGHCLSFVLKGTDVYEAFGRGSKAGIKLDDAKFPLPRLPVGESGSGGGPDGESAGGGSGIGSGGGSDGSGGTVTTSEAAFVCLDMPDLPGEHDDISILFDKEAERDRLAACLPAPVRGSRLAKMF